MNQFVHDRKKQIKFKGISISSGRVAGRICLYSAERHKAVPQYSLTNEDAVEKDLLRYEEILNQCSHELNMIASDVAEKSVKPNLRSFLPRNIS